MTTSFLIFQLDLTGDLVALLVLGFFVIGGLLYFIFRLLKRSVRMALRLAFIAAVFIVVVIGGIAAWWFGSGTTEKPKSKPAANRSR